MTVETPNWMVNLLEGGGGELVSFEHLCFPNFFMNLLIIYSNPHVKVSIFFLYWTGYLDPCGNPKRRKSPQSHFSHC